MTAADEVTRERPGVRSCTMEPPGTLHGDALERRCHGPRGPGPGTTLMPRARCRRIEAGASRARRAAASRGRRRPDPPGVR
jgi:hypothetical protein